MPASLSHQSAIPACKICTIRLEQLCYQRAWWFRAFREVLATGIRLFAIALWIGTDEDKPRSKACRSCLRFRKNALKRRSPLFNWLDGYLNPLFNRVRDSLLTPEELEQARALARSREDPDFIELAPGTPLAVYSEIHERPR
jgi:hypothetical protein